MHDRRQFPRLQVGSEALVMDASGQTLGRVSLVAGGGMSIELLPECSSRQFTPGDRLGVTVVEPGTPDQHRFEIEIRYRQGNVLGVKFV